MNNNILIVEDDFIMAKAISNILKKENYITTIAINGKVAFELLDKFEYDLILTDLMLSINNGLEILQYSKNIHPNTPVIVITSVSSENMIEEVFKLQADDLIRKPILAGELLLRIKRVLNTPDIKLSL